MLFVAIIVRSLLMFYHCVLGPVGLEEGRGGVPIAIGLGVLFSRGLHRSFGVESPEGGSGDEGGRYKCAGKLDHGFCFG